MPLNIDKAVNQLAKRLAARAGLNKTGAVRVALENELRRLDKAIPLREWAGDAGTAAWVRA
jgi:antitoxin VapB